MGFYLIEFSYLGYYLFLLIIVVVLSVLLFLVKGVQSLSNKKWVQIDKNAFVLLFLSLGFGFLGLTLGIFVGFSSSPVINVIIPALLSFIGGFITFLFISPKVNSISNRIGAGMFLSVLSITVIYGTEIGINSRLKAEDEKIWQDIFIAKKMKILENLDKLDSADYKLLYEQEIDKVFHGDYVLKPVTHEEVIKHFEDKQKLEVQSGLLNSFRPPS